MKIGIFHMFCGARRTMKSVRNLRFSCRILSHIGKEINCDWNSVSEKQMGKWLLSAWYELFKHSQLHHRDILRCTVFFENSLLPVSGGLWIKRGTKSSKYEIFPKEWPNNWDFITLENADRTSEVMSRIAKYFFPWPSGMKQVKTTPPILKFTM